MARIRTWTHLNAYYSVLAFKFFYCFMIKNNASTSLNQLINQFNVREIDYSCKSWCADLIENRWFADTVNTRSTSIFDSLMYWLIFEYEDVRQTRFSLLFKETLQGKTLDTLKQSINTSRKSISSNSMDPSNETMNELEKVRILFALLFHLNISSFSR